MVFIQKITTSKTSQHTIMKVYQACFNIRFINYIRNVCFGFCAYSLATFNPAGSNFSQNHSGTKHLYWDFCAEIPSFSSEIPPCWYGMKNVLASYKENIAFKKKWLYAYPVYCLVPHISSLLEIPVSFTVRNLSLMKMLHKIGWKTKVCRTPWSNTGYELNIVLIATVCQLSVR